MSTFSESVTIKAAEYLGYNPKDLVVNMAIELFKDARNYPPSYSEDKITADMTLNINKIAMAVVELDSKEGAENELSHSENGINRQYNKSIMAYNSIPQFLHVI
jgi:hypothetical protein